MKYYAIPGIDNYYVTKDGHVYSRFKKSYRQLKTRINKDGYNSLTLKGKTYTVHILMARTFLENPNGYKYVNHINGNRTDDRLSNLKYSNNLYKSEKYVSMPRKKKNSPYGRKLTNLQVEAIKCLFIHSDMTNGQIAELFDVSRSTISNIVNFKTYRAI